MATEAQNHSGGLFESAKTLAGTLLAIGQTRLQLLSNDLEEERAWLTAMLLWTLISLFCATLAVVLSTLLIAVIFWDTYRLPAIGIMIVVFILGALFAWRVVGNMSRSKPRLFASSLAELSKDREHLTPPSP